MQKYFKCFKIACTISTWVSVSVFVMKVVNHYNVILNINLIFCMQSTRLLVVRLPRTHIYMSILSINWIWFNANLIHQNVSAFHQMFLFLIQLETSLFPLLFERHETKSRYLQQWRLKNMVETCFETLLMMVWSSL